MSPAIPQEQRSLIDRMREAVPGLEWRMSGNAVVGWDTGRDIVSANPRGSLLCWLKTKAEPHAVDIQYPGDTEAVRIVREWWVKTHVAPKMEALVTALKADGWECVVYGSVVTVKRDQQSAMVGYVNGGFIVGDEQRPHSLEVVLDEIRERFPRLGPIAERGERLKALLPMLRWSRSGGYWQGRDASGYLTVSVFSQESDGWVNAWTQKQGPRHLSAAEESRFTTDDELIALLTKWRDATYPQAIDKVGDPDNARVPHERIIELIDKTFAQRSSHDKAETMTPEYRKFIDKVSEFVEAKWSLKDGDLICEARGREYAINHRDGKYTLRGTAENVVWFAFGISTLDQTVAALRHRMFQLTIKERRAALADGIRRYLQGAVVSEGGADNWLSVDYDGARVAVTIDDRYTIRVHGHTLGVSTDSEEGAIRIVRDTLLTEAQRIEHERVEAEIARVNAFLRQTPVQSDTERNDVIAAFMAGTRAMQGMLDLEGIDANLLRVVGQMDQYHVLNLTDPRTRKKHVIAYDGQWYFDGEPIIFDELLNEVLAIVTLEEEQEEMSTRKTRAELAVDGAYLGAAAKTAEEARDAVATLIASNLPAEKQENARGVIADLLRTKAGSGAVAWILGEAINQLPNAGPKVEKFGDSLMVVGAMHGTEHALGMVIDPLKALVSGVVESLPEPAAHAEESKADTRTMTRAVPEATQAEEHEEPHHGRKARTSR